MQLFHCDECGWGTNNLRKFDAHVPVRPASDRRGGRRVGRDRCGWLLIGERSEPALGRSRRRREAGRWSGPALWTRLAVMAGVVAVNGMIVGDVGVGVGW